MAASALELVARFQRCPNYPRDVAGVKALAKGLEKASAIIGVSMASIVDRCSEESQYCPTDWDLMTTARGIRGPQEVRQAPSTCPHDRCDGSGWLQIYHLHTHHSENGRAWVEKEQITQAQYDALIHKIDWVKQVAYESAARCTCHPKREEAE